MRHLCRVQQYVQALEASFIVLYFAARDTVIAEERMKKNNRYTCSSYRAEESNGVGTQPAILSGGGNVSTIEVTLASVFRMVLGTKPGVSTETRMRWPCFSGLLQSACGYVEKTPEYITQVQCMPFNGLHEAVYAVRFPQRSRA